MKLKGFFFSFSMNMSSPSPPLITVEQDHWKVKYGLRCLSWVSFNVRFRNSKYVNIGLYKQVKQVNQKLQAAWHGLAGQEMNRTATFKQKAKMQCHKTGCSNQHCGSAISPASGHLPHPPFPGPLYWWLWGSSFCFLSNLAIFRWLSAVITQTPFLVAWPMLRTNTQGFCTNFSSGFLETGQHRDPRLLRLHTQTGAFQRPYPSKHWDRDHYQGDSVPGTCMLRGLQDRSVLKATQYWVLCDPRITSRWLRKQERLLTLNSLFHLVYNISGR